MKIALVCTQGGHLTEILQILEAFEEYCYFFVTHNSSRDADLKKIAPTYFSESIAANPFRLMRAFIQALKILGQEKPDVILSSGAEIAIPYFVLGKFLSIKTIYLESWCRIKTRSFTGRIVYPFADIFLVQWPEMLEIYGSKARYWGAVI